MSEYRADIDAYEWHLSLPPQAVRALLSAVCVNRDNSGNRLEAIGHYLWGPKYWSISFLGDERFEIAPLSGNRGSFDVFAPQLGSLTTCPLGTRVTLHFAADVRRRRQVRLLFGFIAAVFGLVITTLATSEVPWQWEGVAWAARVLVPLWFGLGFAWLGPRMDCAQITDFLEDVFAPYDIPHLDKAKRPLHRPLPRLPSTQ